MQKESACESMAGLAISARLIHSSAQHTGSWPGASGGEGHFNTDCRSLQNAETGLGSFTAWLSW